MPTIKTAILVAVVLAGLSGPAWGDPAFPLRAVTHTRLHRSPSLHHHRHRYSRPHHGRRYHGFGPRHFGRSYFGFYATLPWYRPFLVGPRLAWTPGPYPGYGPHFHSHYPSSFYFYRYCTPGYRVGVWPGEALLGPVFSEGHLVGRPAARDWLDVIAEHIRKRDAAREPAVHLTSGISTEGWEREVAAEGVETGDRLFREQLYLDALRNYKRAADSSDDWAVPHIRCGYALLALGKHSSAAAAFRRALEVDPTFLGSGFTSDALYGGDLASRTRHLESVASAALESPKASELLFLIGALLRFEGRADQARIFFERSRDPDPEPALRLDGPSRAVEASPAEDGGHRI